MLHELLLALAGFPGNVFRPFPLEPQQPTTLTLADDFPMVHPGERETLNRLAALGFHFMTMNKFIDSCRSSHNSISTFTTGLYLKAMAIALERRLQGYRRVVVETEHSILSGEDKLGGRIPLSTLAARFSEYQLVFPVICDLLKTLEGPNDVDLQNVELSEDTMAVEDGEGREHQHRHPTGRPPYHGAKLIDLLQDKAASGVPIVQEWLNDMLSSCCAVMMRQIVAWVIYGQVQDPFGEWFIVSTASSKTYSTASRSTSHIGLRHNISSSTASLSRDRRGERSEGVRRWQAEYKLNESLLPKMIPSLLATEILFIGKAIATARDARPKPVPIPDAMTRRHLEWIMPLVQSLSQQRLVARPSAPSSTSLGGGGGQPPPSPPLSPMDEEQQPTIQTSSLPYNTSTTITTTTTTQPFSLRPLMQVIHSIRKDVVEHLWVNVRVGKTMVAALRSFQRYFLLADGGFGLGLIDAIDEFKRAKLLRKHGARAAPTIRDQDLSGILFKAAKGTPAQEDISLQQFELNVLLKPAGKIQPQPLQSFDDQLLGIPTRLNYRLMWPLDLLLTADDLKQYSDVFAFLISIRKAQVQIQRAWTHVKMLSQLARKRRQVLQRAAIKRRAMAMQGRGGGGHGNDGSDMTEHERLQQEQNVAQEEELVRLISTMQSSKMFIIDSLWSYLQMDVLDPTFNALIQSIVPEQPISSAQRSSLLGSTTSSSTHAASSSFDFDTIYATHAETLHEIQSACLLTSNELVTTVKTILQAVENFSGIVARRAADGEDGFRIGISTERDEVAWQDWADLSSANKIFREQTHQLYLALSRASKSGIVEDGPVLRRSISGMGSIFLLGNGPKSAEVIRLLDRLLLRLEYAKALWFQPPPSHAEGSTDINQ